MKKPNNPPIETGAMTLVLLVKYYKSQMIALLLKNGVAVGDRATDQQIAMLMANLLKVSKSFYVDLNNFIQNPKVIQALKGGIMQNAQYFRMSGNAQYFRMSGKGYMNVQGVENQPNTNEFGFPTTSSSDNTSDDEGGFFSDINLMDVITKGLDAFGKYDKNKTDRAIADAKGRLGRALTPAEISKIEEESGNGGSGGTKDDTPPKKMSTTTIVVLSLVGVAVIGTIIYFVARPKK
jgi:hypothetical protein